MLSWKSKKHHTISKSVLEVEYCSLTVTTCKIQWITYLLKNLHVIYIKPILLYYEQPIIYPNNFRPSIS